MKKHQQLGTNRRLQEPQGNAKDGTINDMIRVYVSKHEGREMDAWRLPKTSKKHKPRPGSQSRHGKTCGAQLRLSPHEYRKLEPAPNPVLKSDRIIAVRGATGMIEVDKSKKWQPKGLIPKGF